MTRWLLDGVHYRRMWLGQLCGRECGAGISRSFAYVIAGCFPSEDCSALPAKGNGCEYHVWDLELSRRCYVLLSTRSTTHAKIRLQGRSGRGRETLRWPWICQAGSLPWFVPCHVILVTSPARQRSRSSQGDGWTWTLPNVQQTGISNQFSRASIPVRPYLCFVFIKLHAEHQMDNSIRLARTRIETHLRSPGDPTWRRGQLRTLFLQG